MTERTFIFRPLDWHINSKTEKEDNEIIITCGGVLEDGRDIVIEIINFKSFLIVELPQEVEGVQVIWNPELYEKMYTWLETINKSAIPVDYNILDEYKIYQKSRHGNFMKLYFNTHRECTNFRRALEDGTANQGFKPHSFYCPVFGKVLNAGDVKFHETNVNPLIKFIIEQNLRPTGWVKIKEYISEDCKNLSIEERAFSDAAIDCCVDHKDVIPADNEIDPNFQPPIKVASWDIETFCQNFNSKMPDPKNHVNRVYGIGICMADLQATEKDYEIHIIALENPPNIQGVTMHRCKTEAGLLIRFAKFMKEHNPYILLGHNIYGFDWDYMIKRAKMSINDCYIEFSKLTKMQGQMADEEEISWNSKAYHNMKFTYMKPVGRLSFDLMIETERQGYRLRSYALNVLGETFLGEFKKDLPYRHQFIIFHLQTEMRKTKSLFECKNLVKKFIKKDDCFDDKGVITQLGELKQTLLKAGKNIRSVMRNQGYGLIMEYLKQDVILPLKIFHKMNMWMGAQQSSNIFRVPIEYLQTRGQQIKVLAQFKAVADEEKTVLGFKSYEEQYDWNIQGALVQDIIKGYHQFVLTYDFTSLYPSTIIAYNISHDTLANPYETDATKFNIIEWTEHKFCGCPEDPHKGKKGKNDRILCSKNEHLGTPYEGKYRFVFKKMIKKLDNNGKEVRIDEGLFPRFLRNLLSERKFVKKQVKIIEEWVYGKDFTSKSHRKAIQLWTINDNSYDKDIINNYQKFISNRNIDKKNLDIIRNAIADIYQNPVLTKETVYRLLIALVVLDKKQLAIKISANSGYGGLGTETGALCFKPGAACTTAMGRKLITLGIQHTRKKFHKEKLSEIFNRPVEEGFKLVYGDSVSEDTPMIIRIDNEIRVEKVSRLNFYEIKWEKYHDTKESIIVDGLEVWQSDENGSRFTPVKRIIRHKTNKQMFRITTSTGIVDVTEDHSLLNLYYEKITPKEVKIGTQLLHSNMNALKETFKQHNVNFYDLCVTDNYTWSYNKKVVCNSKLEAARIQIYELSKGYNLTKIREEHGMYYLEFNNYILGNNYAILDIIKLPNTESYVYDLETESHHFGVAPGNLVVHNTDSFMCCFPSLTIGESWKMIDLIQTELDSGIFPDPIHLEFECMYGKYFQLSKKCYVSWKMEPKNKNIITDNPEDWKILDKIQKGVVSSRRDNCKYVTQGFDELMDMAMNKESKLEDMRYYVADYAYKLMCRSVEVKDLVITKGVGNIEDYEKEDEEGNVTLTNQGHIQLANKMLEERDEDVQNTRLQYLYVKYVDRVENGKFEDLTQGDVIEDYTYYKNNYRSKHIVPYYIYYLTHTIESHFDKILDFRFKPQTKIASKLDDLLELELDKLEELISPSKFHYINQLNSYITINVNISESVLYNWINRNFIKNKEEIFTIKEKLYEKIKDELKNNTHMQFRHLDYLDDVLTGKEKNKIYINRKMFMDERSIKTIKNMVGLTNGELDNYISLLRQRHSHQIIKHIQDVYGFTNHGGGTRDGSTIQVDGNYTEKLIKAHLKYTKVINDLTKKFHPVKHKDQFKEVEFLV